MRLGYEKALASEALLETRGRETFIEFLRTYKELSNEEERVKTLLDDAKMTEEMAGTLILMCDSDPTSDTFIEQLQKEACEEREKATSQV